MATVARKHYVLDTSVASLILDGCLWEWYPNVLVGYKSDLQAALFHQEEGAPRCALKDLPGHSLYLKRAINAYEWSKKITGSDISSRPRLLLTPTVCLELTMAPAVSTSIFLLCLGFIYNIYLYAHSISTKTGMTFPILV